MSIEERFDIPFVGRMALREKQIQQNYRPVIAVHKWFARRPGTLFRGLLLAEFGHSPVRDSFFSSHNLNHIKVADPFMGGGTPLLEANRLGCDVVGFDVNPMAYWVVKEELEHLPVPEYERAATELLEQLESDMCYAYTTTCQLCGDSVPVKYFLWVKQVTCTECRSAVDLFPGYLVAKDARHPKKVYVCPACGSLNERATSNDLGACDQCAQALKHKGPASRGKVECHACGTEVKYPQPESGPPAHRLFAIEYHCAKCKASHKGRFFKAPDQADLEKIREAETRARDMAFRFVPDAQIPKGDETKRLHRWGYTQYREMFSPRQLVGLESSCRLIAQVSDRRIRNALATNLSDLLRYQNLLCRYDAWALKSLDIFSVHGFPVGLIQCESNLLGIAGSNGSNVGSGGWRNITAKFAKAKAYCEHPFEVTYNKGRKQLIHCSDEWIGDARQSDGARRIVDIRCANAAAESIDDNSLDAVFTDPPYFGNVQYGELMDFCYVWLRNLVGQADDAFSRECSLRPSELTGNTTQERGIEDFAKGLSRVFQNMASALKKHAPLGFTYHHNEVEAYAAVAMAVLDAGLWCTAAIPCPAEMQSSIHINGTKSSVIDTVFVCRDTLTEPDPAHDMVSVIRQDLAAIQAAGREPTEGDGLCIVNGRLTQMAINALLSTWDKHRQVAEKLSSIRTFLDTSESPPEILDQALVKPLPEFCGGRTLKLFQ